MTQHKNIRILFIENDPKEVEKFTLVQKVKETLNGEKYEIIFISDESFLSSNASREEQKHRIIKFISERKNDFDMLIFDLMLLREGEEGIDKNYNSYNTLLSVEIAGELYEELKEKKILIGFTSSLGNLNNPKLFNKFKSVEGNKVNDDWFFVIKPMFDLGDLDYPSQAGCIEECGLENHYEDSTCNDLECIYNCIVSQYKRRENLNEQ